jgi:HK97 gp10 family phage protein
VKVTGKWQGMDALQRDLAKLGKAAQGQTLRGALRAGVSPIAKAIQRDSPSKRVRKAIIVKVSGRGLLAEARIGAKKGTFGGGLLHLIEDGTKGHTIRAKGGKVLAVPMSLTSKGRGRRARAQVNAGTVFGAVVHHPGTRARPFFRKALSENRAEFQRKFASAFKQILTKQQTKITKVK